MDISAAHLCHQHLHFNSRFPVEPESAGFRKSLFINRS